MLLSFGLLGGILFAIERNNWIGLVVLSLVLLFILGADVTAMLRAWRGVAEPPDRGPVP